MPAGDVRNAKGPRYSGGGSTNYYNDEGRGQSKSAWEWFEYNYENSGFSDQWLITLEDSTCYRLIAHSTSRFGLEDIATYRDPNGQGYDQAIREEWYDSRARRLIEQKSKGKTDQWVLFHRHLCEGYDRRKVELEEARKQQWIKWDEESKRRDAEAAKVVRDNFAPVAKNIELVSGAIHSDFNTALNIQEVHSQYTGDLDDPVSGYIDGRGFTDEMRKPGGIKLQITLSLDVSNSMKYNRIATEAATAFRDTGLSLRQLHEEYPEDFFYSAFIFSEDLGDGEGEIGKRAYRLHPKAKPAYEDEMTRAAQLDVLYGEFKEFETRTDYRYMFTGQDTWMFPLFLEIENWEKHYSEPGAARLDIIITDAVLEHPTDIRQSDAIQERRDGNLQTVLLNFMPENEWTDGTLPKRCVQYPAHADNISGLLRQIISEFISVNM